MSGILTLQVRNLMFVALAAVAVLAPSGQSQAETRVAVSFFHDELATDGYWVHHAHYGTVWYPRHRPADWQPYVHGRWVWTSDYGWYWESYEDWGWATYHYGRWADTSDYGWVWVPDDEWGPAWVEWRTGGGHVGWAPMPPEVTWRGGSFIYAGVDLSAPRYRSHWVFVTEANFSKADPWRHRAPRKRSSTILKASARVTNYGVVNARIVNRSIDVGRISAAANVRIRPSAVIISDTRVRVRGRGDGRIAVYRPRITTRAKIRAKRPPVRARVETESRVEIPPFGGPPRRGSSRGGAGVGIGGGGIGIGGGGGLRIGR